MELTEKVQVFNTDCMDYMKDIPDGYFDLSIVDPPYGIDVTKMNVGGRKRNKQDKKKSWDLYVPDKEYFDELFRISKNQIIWGGNYFELKPTRCFIVWDKGLGLRGRSFSECELAWTSFDRPARIFSQNPVQPDRIHPTQKTVKLYEWILKNYANEGDKILDSHLGSGSSAIACHNYGYEFVGCELDEDYFNDMVKRFKQVTAQRTLF